MSEATLQPSEADLITRFRRLKDKQKSFASRTIDLLLSNDSLRPRDRAEHVVLAVKWRMKDARRPIKTIDECKGFWENPTGQKFDVADTLSDQIVPIENVE
jgi:hypothetical protein